MVKLELNKDGNYHKWFKTSFMRDPQDNSQDSPIPTTSCFSKTDYSNLICGFNDACISLYDFKKQCFHSKIKTYKEDNLPVGGGMELIQPNCFAMSESVPILYSGFEDSTIKSIDLRSKSVVNSTNAHNDSVSSLSLLNDIYLFSTSHDTKIKLWDTRNMNTPLQHAVGSQQKWDEAVWDSLVIPNQLVLATGNYHLTFSWCR